MSIFADSVLIRTCLAVRGYVRGHQFTAGGPGRGGGEKERKRRACFLPMYSRRVRTQRLLSILADSSQKPAALEQHNITMAIDARRSSASLCFGGVRNQNGKINLGQKPALQDHVALPVQHHNSDSLSVPTIGGDSAVSSCFSCFQSVSCCSAAVYGSSVSVISAICCGSSAPGLPHTVVRRSQRIHEAPCTRGPVTIDQGE